ncbi:SNF2-related protein [Kiritimatiellota bacterium B12222]|nr:SNF2-related protein [Kiritimatiellota bacterium B12222]
MNPETLQDLRDQLSYELPYTVVKRGEDLAQKNAVEIIIDSAIELFAHVQGSQSQPYEVGIVAENINTEGADYLFCNCMFFSKEQVGCKHLVALLDTKLKKRSSHAPQRPDWEKRLQKIQALQKEIPPPAPAPMPAQGELKFLLDQKHPVEGDTLMLAPCSLTKNEEGQQIFKPLNVNLAWEENWNPKDRACFERLMGIVFEENCGFMQYRTEKRLPIPFLNLDNLLPELLDQERIYLNAPDAPPRLLHNHMSQAWEVLLKGNSQGQELSIEGVFAYEDQQREFSEAALTLDQGYIIWTDGISRFKNPQQHSWCVDLFQNGEIKVPSTQVKSFISSIYELPHLPKLELPPELSSPTNQLDLHIELALEFHPDFPINIIGRLFFNYDDYKTHSDNHKTQIYFPETNSLLIRDMQGEQEAIQMLTQLGGQFIPKIWNQEMGEWKFSNIPLPLLVSKLGDEGWTLVWNGKNIHHSSSFSLDVRSSGVDWFDVEGKLAFDEENVPFPELLKAVKNGEHLIALPNGGQGWIPEEIREQIELLGKMGSVESNQNALRFQGAQSLMLDMLLSQQPDVDWDEKSRTLQQKLRAISSPEPFTPPDSFNGDLRAYQKEGLGWLIYLKELGIHGCLADDMGLGKTVQVLALLEHCRLQNAGPSFVVMPKSLIYNWQAEAAKFTPKLRVAVLHGPQRPKSVAELPEADLYLSSYPLVIRDAHWLKNMDFHYVILDESQAIKNEGTKSHKACRLLKSRHRLTMTGTPVENRLDDLWSQLNFLNPGLLGTIKNQGSRELSHEGLDKVAVALRPFLLRRTKEMVATDLPEKIEETLICDMLPKQAKAYKELQSYYRKALTKSVNDKGLNQSKIMVLEALLRLRQTACHPGLVDPDKMSLGSGKLQVMMELLEDILPAGHKVLIFSQFTSFLSIVKSQLDQQEIPYAYLDGKSKDRQAEIDRFQTQEDCPVFLISLKAGGVGLNLTAADYILLLDPWWNPAVEAQAIDRAHRIGQTKKVIAYRIVSKDSIEDKILQLQQKKRELADAILREENSILSGLSPEDLEFLLGV